MRERVVKWVSVKESEGSCENGGLKKKEEDEDEEDEEKSSNLQKRIKQRP